MKLVADYFNRVNVSYFIYGGTALAVYREGGKIIKHDGDIDVAILETVSQTLSAILINFRH